jgi:hypothetical protein
LSSNAILVVVLAVVGVAGLSVALLASGGERSPSSVVRAFHAAAVHGDCERALDYFVDDEHEAALDECTSLAHPDGPDEGGFAPVEAVTRHQEGDVAVVAHCFAVWSPAGSGADDPGDEPSDGEDHIVHDIALTREHGSWQITRDGLLEDNDWDDTDVRFSNQDCADAAG